MARPAPPPAVVTSRRHDLAQRLRRLARGRTDDDQALLLDGPHLVQVALDARWPLELVAVAGPRADGAEFAHLLDRARAAGVPVVAVTDAVMEASSPVKSASGIVALGRPRHVTLAALLSPAPALVVVAVDVQDPGNVGAIARSADAFGATGLACGGACADPFGWKALRGSMGSTLRLPVVRDRSADGLLEELRDRGVQIVATAANATDHAEHPDWSVATALLVGNEGAGVPHDLVAHADRRVAIPMRRGVESLNVAVATGVILYEAARQRAAAATP